MRVVLPTDSAKITKLSAAVIPKDQLTISVIMPVRNEAEFIQSTLSQLLEQEYDANRFEILVVDGQSTDGTPALVRQLMRKHGNVHLLENPKHLSSAARNIGIKQAKSDVVLIIDGHCEIPTRRLLSNVANAFDKSKADCLGRPQSLNVEKASTLQQAIAAARNSRLGHHPESFIYSNEPQFVPAKSVGVAYRREVFEKIGLFDEAFDAHEDGELNHRLDQAGLSCYFTPEIAVKYIPRGNLRSLFNQMARYGRGRVRFSHKHAGTWSLSALIPALFVIFVLLGGLLALALPTISNIYVAGLGIYALVAATFTVVISIQERKPSFILWLPLVFFAVHSGAGAGILAEKIAPQSAKGPPDATHFPVA